MLDHVGGTAAVVGRVDRALIGPSSGPDDDRVVDELRRGGAQVDHGVQGLSGVLGQLRWTVLWPPPTGVEPGNPASITLSVSAGPTCRGGCLSALMLGDLGQESQARLIGGTRLGHYDVVKMAHHGSRDQERRLYLAIRATVGLIGVGADNDYGHPTADALGMLSDSGTRVVRSDLDGLALVADRGGGRIAVWTEHRRTPGPGPAGDRTGGSRGSSPPVHTPRRASPRARRPRRRKWEGSPWWIRPGPA